MKEYSSFEESIAHFILRRHKSIAYTERILPDSTCRGVQPMLWSAIFADSAATAAYGST